MIKHESVLLNQNFYSNYDTYTLTFILNSKNSKDNIEIENNELKSEIKKLKYELKYLQSKLNVANGTIEDLRSNIK